MSWQWHDEQGSQAGPDRPPPDAPPERAELDETRPSNPQLATPEDWPPPVPLVLPSPYSAGGIAYLTIYDEQALHEQGNPIYHPRQRSGGVAHYVCAVTGKGWSVPLDPRPAPPEPPR